MKVSEDIGSELATIAFDLSTWVECLSPENSTRVSADIVSKIDSLRRIVEPM
jgi:hypothetical protein